ncbi:hypothetical protein EJD97_015023 [Solanum chilense]|uniref:Uncharacterized protein n=1 Tax=Solanum chilense TaxID=4083 RepID=A0A6N2AEE1_SOLCI|nr:hypothetical protein EJD97_015023 [Solanum chilense]
MAGNPADGRFRPPDPQLQVGNPIVQAQIHDVAEEASSTSSQLREEAVQIATVEAEIDAFRHNMEKGNTSRTQEGVIQRVEEQRIVEKIVLQKAAKEAATSNRTPSHSDENRQESGIGELSPVRDSHTHQIGVGKDALNVESAQEGNRDGAQQRFQEP